jgi:catechol 2,3-dioxygenase-like lactoylglutathione lyase family enzyme
MKAKSVSGFSIYVKDLDETEKFYDLLGFLKSKRESDYLSVRMNWYFIDFHLEGKSDIPDFYKETTHANKGSGIFIYLSVDDVDAYYDFLIEQGLKPAGKPENTSWGNREFLILDPDGYKIVFFKRK